VEAATAPPRELIVDAMRRTVAARGIAGATFDQVAREAGVSRGLLHYYFGTKERLLVEAVRRESAVTMEQLEQTVGAAGSAEEVLEALVQGFEDFVGEGEGAVVTFFEILTLAQRNEEIAGELRELARQTRLHMADLLGAKSEAGVLELHADPEAAAGFILALADGLTVRMLSEPELDIGPMLKLAVSSARALVS
jgi:AcrR family transcriptional regulator